MTARAQIDSSTYSHVVVCRCGYREVCSSTSAAREVRDRHDLAAHPEHYRHAIEAMSKRSTRRR